MIVDNSGWSDSDSGWKSSHMNAWSYYTHHTQSASYNKSQIGIVSRVFFDMILNPSNAFNYKQYAQIIFFWSKLLFWKLLQPYQLNLRRLVCAQL